MTLRFEIPFLGVEIFRVSAESAELTSLLGLLHRVLDNGRHEAQPIVQDVVETAVKSVSKAWLRKLVS